VAAGIGARLQSSSLSLLYRNLRDLGFPGVPDPIVRDGWGISFLLELHCGGEPWPKDL
jgi:hypothetical protein